MGEIVIADVALDNAFEIRMGSVFEDHIQAKSAMNVAYGVVEPGAKAAAHIHAERELFLAIEGSAIVWSKGVQFRLDREHLFVADPGTEHVIENAGTTQFTFLSLYWFPSSSRSEAHVRGGGAPKRTVLLIAPTPPTPNGDLHLGHLSGPYLAADVHARFARLTGTQAQLVSGNDDFQSYVVAKAKSDGTSPAEVCRALGDRIRTTLDLFDVRFDRYISSSVEPGYAAAINVIAQRIVSSHHVSFRSVDALVDAANGEYLYEPDVRGNCPNCRSACNGNICEECGHPNNCIDIVDCTSSSGRPMSREAVSRFFIDISAFRDELLAHYSAAGLSPRLMEFVISVLNRKDLSIAITHPTSWGIEIITPGGPQRFWVWCEMAFAPLFSFATLNKTVLPNIGDEILSDGFLDAFERDVTLVHYFGFDNSFYHLVLFPIMYKLSFGRIPNNIQYRCNEFYLLDGLKFSTSRRHAIWGGEILKQWPSDIVRYVLSRSRPERRRTNFTTAMFHEAVGNVFISGWHRLMRDTAACLSERFGGVAPVCGLLTASHATHLQHAQSLRDRGLRLWDSSETDLRTLCLEIEAFLSSTISTLHAIPDQPVASRPSPEARASMAIVLASMKLAALIAEPIMPGFAQRVLLDLGVASPEYPDGLEFVEPDRPVTFTSLQFFEHPCFRNLII